MPAPSSASASVPSLRFPKPQGSQRLANWISSSSPDIMSQPVPSPAVGDDAMAEFEMINTDDENENESVDGSDDFVTTGRPTRPDDTVSLASTNNTTDQDDDTPEEDDSIDGDGASDYHGIWRLPSVGRPGQQSPLRGYSPPSFLEVEAPCQVASLPSHSLADDPFSTQTSRCLCPDDVAADSTTDHPHTQEAPAAKSGPAQIVKALLDDPDIEPWRRILRIVVAAFLLGALVNALLPSAREATGAGSSAVQTTQTHTASITVLATPATVTVTVTSTSTVRPTSIHDLARRLVSTADEAARAVEGACMPVLLSVASRVWNGSADSIKSVSEVASRHLPGQPFVRLSRGLTEVASRRLSGGAIHKLGKSIEVTATKAREDASQMVSQHLKAVDALRDDLNFNILKAQISSWLICLQIRGDKAEYQRYQARAVEHLRVKHREIMDKRARSDKSPPSTRFLWGMNMRWSTAG